MLVPMSIDIGVGESYRQRRIGAVMAAPSSSYKVLLCMSLLRPHEHERHERGFRCERSEWCESAGASKASHDHHRTAAT